MATRTDAQLTTDANVIKNETAPGANTATRVGNMLVDAIDSKLNIDKIASPTVVGATKLYANLAASNADGAVSQAGIKTAVDLKADSAIEAWSNLTYTAPWTTANFQAKYRKNNFGEVALKGQVWTNPTNVTGGTLIIGTLPAGYRPVHNLLFPIEYYNGSARAFSNLQILSNGNIQYNGITGVVPSVNLDAIRFYTD